jgi:hypothetical protein
MSVAPHAGIVDFGTFTPPTLTLDGIQGEVPQPLIGQENYVLTGNGWSSIGALGGLTYQGTWDASTNTPTLVSSVGVQGYYYVVSVAGNTDLNGTTTWDVGDWAIFNGSAWQKIEGGSAGTFQTLTVTGQAALNTISGNTSIANTSTVGQLGVKLGTGQSIGGNWDTKSALFGNVALTNGAGSGALGISFDTTSGATLSSIAPGVAWYNIRYAGNIHQFFGNGGGEQFRVTPINSAVNYVQVQGSTTGNQPFLLVGGSDANTALGISSKGNGNLNLFTNGGGNLQFQVAHRASADIYLSAQGGVGGASRPSFGAVLAGASASGFNIYNSGGQPIRFQTNGNGGNDEQFIIAHTASTVNSIQATGASTGNSPALSAQGSDANVNLLLSPKGNAQLNVFMNGGSQFRVSNVASSVNYLEAKGNTSTNVPVLSAQGADANISMALQPKGTGAIDLAAGSSGVNISNGNTVTAVTRVAGGNSYTTALTATISAPTTAGGTTATATAYAGAITVGIAGGGTGYTLNDVITVVGGTRTQAQTCTVTGVSGGVITAVTVQTFGFYTVLPTNPVSVTGGTGTGATLNLSNWSFTNITLDTAGSGYIEQPTVTISGTGGSGATAFATIGSNTSIKTHGNYASFFASNSGSESLRLYGNDSGGGQFQQATGPGLVIIPAQSGYAASRIGTQQNFHQLELGSGINTAGAVATAFNTGVTYGPSSGGIGSGSRQFVVAHTASAANYVQVTGAATGGLPTISAQGSDANIGLRLSSKGSGTIDLSSNGNPYALQIQGIASGSNYNQWRLASGIGGSGLGSAPVFSTWGIDTNISMAFQPKGTGAIDLAAGSSGVNISNGGTVTSITRTNQGSGYTTITGFTWSASAPTTAGGVTATGAVTSLGGVSATIAGGGTGYTAGDVLTVSGGTFSSASSIRVDTVSSGVITAATLTNGGTYTVIPANPASVTGGTGTGATFNVTYGVVGLSITTAGSGYIEQPTITFSGGGGGTNAAAYATVGSDTVVRSLGNNMAFYTPNGRIGFRVTDFGGATATGYWNALGGSTAPQLRATGSSSGVILTESAVPIQFQTASVEQFRVAHTAAAVNYIQVQGSATGNATGPIMSMQGSDANIATQIQGKGTGSVNVLTVTSLGGTVGNTAELFSAKGFNTNQAALRASQFRHSTGTDWTTASLRLGQRIDATDMSYIEYNPAGFAQGIAIQAANNQPINFRSNGEQFRVAPVSSTVNFQVMSGSAANNSVQYYSAGSDTNISMAIQPKGTGAINLAAGSRGVNISNGSTVTVITRTATGSGYTTPPTWTASAPTTTGGVTASGSVNNIILVSATVAGGGTGYTVGDTLTIVGGTFSVAATLTVLTVSAGVITSVTSPQNGLYTVAPTTPVSVTGGTGSSATFNVSFGISPNFTITTAGAGYVEQPTITFSGGGGSAAAAFASVGTVTTIKGIGSAQERTIQFQGLNGFNILELDGTSTNTTAESIRIQPTQFNRTNIVAVGGVNSQMWLSASGTGFINLATRGTSLVTQFRVADTASAVNYLTVTGNVTGSSPIIQATGSDTNISLSMQTKGTGITTFNSGGGEQFRIQSAANAVNNIQVVGQVAGSPPTLVSRGSDANVGLVLASKGTASISLATGVSTATQVSIADTASAVNFTQLTGAITSNYPMLTATGTDANVGFLIRTKGAPAGPGFRIENNNGSNVCAAVQMSVTSPVNYPYLQPAATGFAPSFSANGSDTNIDLALTPKGTGRVRYGTHTANADAPITGYIEILDSSGTIRKLAVIT